MFKTKGVKGFLNNVQKTADLVEVGTPNMSQLVFVPHVTIGVYQMSQIVTIGVYQTDTISITCHNRCASHITIGMYNMSQFVFE